MNRKLIVLLLVLALGVAVVAGAYFTSDDKPSQKNALTELNIGNLTCGSCVSKVQAALAKVKGVGQIDINVTNGRGQLTYNPDLISSTQIAEIVSEAGYPSSVRLDMSAVEYEKSMTENAQLSAKYIARIGARLISREDFDQAISLRSSGLSASPSPYAGQQLQGQVWKELKEREVLLAAAASNQIVIQDGEVDVEIKRIKAATKDFDTAVVARFGNYDSFFRQLKESMIINRNIENNVVAGLSNDREKQLRFSQWYDETLQATNIVIFDPAIKQADAAGNSSCGGSCGSK